MIALSDELVILIRVLAGVGVGGLIGFERSFRGRPAGFQHEMVLRGRDRRDAGALSRHLSQLPEVLEFRIDPMGA